MRIILHGGRIVTMDGARPEVEAVGIDGGKIAAAGTQDEVRAVLGSGERHDIDLRGNTLLPGFIDGHAHLSSFGAQVLGINLKSSRSISEIREEVRRGVRTLPAGTWIRGSGYNDFLLAERRHPTRADLDDIAPEHPVLLTRTCGHIAVANTAALRSAGIRDREDDPYGGRFGRHENGSLNGVLYEAAQEHMQQAARESLEDLKTYVTRGSQEWSKAGITAFTDAGGPPGYLRALTDAVEEGLVVQHVEAIIWNGLGVRQLDAFLPSEIRTGFRLGKLTIGAAKVMVDGSSSGPTCATRQGYAIDPKDHGIQYQSLDELKAILARAAENGFQVTTHAVGDLGIQNSIEAIAAAGTPERRNRIEHCAMCASDLIPQLVDAQITPVGQPRFLHEFGDGYVVDYGQERGSHMFPLRSWIAAGIRPVGSSDSPVAEYRPLRGMATAMTRQTATGQVLAPEERIGLDEALAMYTVNAAWVQRREHDLGMIRPGFASNVVVVEGDIRSFSPHDLEEAPVRLTLIDGEAAWDDGLLGS